MAKAAPAVLMTDVVEAVDEATVLRLREARREASSPAQVVIAEIAEAKNVNKSLFSTCLRFQKIDVTPSFCFR